MTSLPRPEPGEHHEYYRRYIDMVPDGDILETLRDQLGDTIALLQTATPEQETYRYAEGKWSLRESVGHVIDIERLFSFRALTIARQDGTDLPGMDPDDWAKNSNADERPLVGLLDEWIALRRANVHMFANFDAETGTRSGLASGYEFTVRSFPWILAGHELWHRQIFRERYLAGGEG